VEREIRAAELDVNVFAEWIEAEGIDISRELYDAVVSDNIDLVAAALRNGAKATCTCGPVRFLCVLSEQHR
jgi:hypothetical protein